MVGWIGCDCSDLIHVCGHYTAEALDGCNYFFLVLAKENDTAIIKGDLHDQRPGYLQVFG